MVILDVTDVFWFWLVHTGLTPKLKWGIPRTLNRFLSYLQKLGETMMPFYRRAQNQQRSRHASLVKRVY